MTSYEVDVSSPVPDSDDYIGCYNDMLGDRVLTTVITDDAMTSAVSYFLACCLASRVIRGRYIYGTVDLECRVRGLRLWPWLAVTQGHSRENDSPAPSTS